MSTTSTFTPNANKVVNLKQGGLSWKEVAVNTIAQIDNKIQLYLENDISLDVKNEYEDPFKEIIEAAKKTKFGAAVTGVLQAVNEISAITSGVRLQTEYTGAKAWKGSSKIEFSLSFNFYMGSAGIWSGKEEVYNPIAALGKMFMPRRVTEGGKVITNGLFIKGPGPSYVEILGNIGADLINTWASPDPTALNAQKAKFENLPGIISITIGQLYNFNSVLPQSFSFSFSKDLDNKGYPISGTVTVALETVTTGTSNRYLPAHTTTTTTP
jgi:hypothetical protein